MAALLAALRSGIGEFSLIDATLPRGQSAGLERNAVFACCAPLEPPARQFLARFRQSGGHREMQLVQAGGSNPATTANLLETVDRSRKVVVFTDTPAQAQALAGLAEQDFTLVCRASAAQALPRAGLDSWLKGRRVVAVTWPTADQTFLWMVPPDIFETVKSALAQASALLKPAAGRPRKPRSAEGQVHPDAVFAFAIPEASPCSANAGALIHDGGYRSESDGQYSWLWTGPSNHFRILLTGLPSNPAKISVAVIKTENALNLAKLRVLVDGRHVPHRLQPWSDLSGKVTVELNASGDDLRVLSLVCPQMVPDADGRRLLGLCIDRIELVS